ncbi:MAG: B12-binding domain-containing radical SAM protein [Methanobacterium sp.]
MVRANDVVFVISPSLWYERMYPSGILCLSSYLKNNGLDNIILDSKLSTKEINMEDREKLILDEILRIKPRLVCFSATHKEFDEVTNINYKIKSADNNIITIVGGSQPTYRPTDFLDNGFDFVCIGEGEKTVYEFANEVINDTKNWEHIDGIAWKKGQNNVFNKERALISEDEINSVEIPAYEKIDRRYFDISGAIIRGMILKGALLLTTRGCPFSCSFCGCNLIFGRKLRYKSLENVEKEIKYLKENFDIEGIWIVDDTFTINKKHVIGVSKILKKYNVVWGCQSRVNTLDEELVKIMKDSGCIQIDLGVESGSQRILNDIIHKGTKVEQIIESFKLLKKYKIRALANFMIGLPTETNDDLKKTMELAEKIEADEYVFSIATPLPGTELYDMVGVDISPNDYALIDWNGSILTEKLNKSDIKDIEKKLKMLRRKYLLKSIFKSISFRNLKFYFNKGYKLKRIKFTANYLIKNII